MGPLRKGQIYSGGKVPVFLSTSYCFTKHCLISQDVCDVSYSFMYIYLFSAGSYIGHLHDDY